MARKDHSLMVINYLIIIRKRYKKYNIGEE